LTMPKPQPDPEAEEKEKLEDLQKRYRLMEGDRKSYSEESQNIIRKQRGTIEKLKSDNEGLNEELLLETKNAKFSGSASVSQQIAKLQDSVDMYTRKNDLEKRKIEEVDKQISRFQKDILSQRQKMKGQSSRDHANKIAKQIRILENRLDKALQQFNMALAHNKKLREEIDNLRRERVVFDGIYKKLEFELQQKKMRMTEIIDVANTAYEARDAAQADMTALKLQVDKETQDFEIAWKDLNKEIEKDKKNKDIQRFKEREKEKGDQRGDLSIEEEAKLRRKVTKNTWNIAKEKANISVVKEKNEDIEAVLDKIIRACQPNTYQHIDDLVAQFINAEAQNYSHFNYVNELNTEIEKAEEALEEVKKEIDVHEKKNFATAEENMKVQKDLADRVRKMNDKATAYDEKEREAKDTITSLVSGINKIFRMLGCNPKDIVELLGEQTCTETNMLQYLGAIEQRANFVLGVYLQQQAHRDKLQEENLSAAQPILVPGSSTTVLGKGPQAQMNSIDLKITAPTTGEEFDDEEDSDEEEEDDRFLSREELKARTLKGLTKKAQSTSSSPKRRSSASLSPKHG